MYRLNVSEEAKKIIDIVTLVEGRRHVLDTEEPESWPAPAQLSSRRQTPIIGIKLVPTTMALRIVIASA